MSHFKDDEALALVNGLTGEGIPVGYLSAVAEGSRETTPIFNEGDDKARLGEYVSSFQRTTPVSHLNIKFYVPPAITGASQESSEESVSSLEQELHEKKCRKMPTSRKPPKRCSTGEATGQEHFFSSKNA